MNKAIVALLALPLAAGFGAGAANAADAAMVDHGTRVMVRDGTRTPYRVRTGPVMTTDRPAVYGWSYRPLDCGVYHYWDGSTCVDSRVVPPNIGPK